MYHTLRDSTFGQVARLVLPTSTSHKLFAYPEEKPDYVLPPRYQTSGHVTPASSLRSETATVVERDLDAALAPAQTYPKQRPIVEEGAEGWAGEAVGEPESVDWYDDQDPENPQ
jgi:hypothetical protein